jgi:fucose permease
MRESFGLPLDALVALLVSSTIGFVVGSVAAGQLMARFGIGRFLLVANILYAMALWGFASAPDWWILVAIGLLTGASSGAIGTGLNIYVATTRTVRTMNWMHASFGVGATIGPLLMTAIIGAGLSWRLGYAIAGCIHLSLGLTLIFALNHFDFRGMRHGPASGDGKALQPPSSAATLRMPIVLLGVLLFLLYTGTEVTTGQWSYSLFTEARSISPYLAGIMTSVFWGMLTIGRVAFGAAADRVGVERLLRLSMAGATVAAVLFLFRSPAISLVTIALMGLSLSVIFPTLTADTPHRVGRRHTNNAIGLQTGAASVGFAVLPGLAGFLAERLGLEIIGPFLMLSASSMAVTNEIVIRLVRKRALEMAASLHSTAD